MAPTPTTGAAPGGWRVERVRGHAGELHALDVPRGTRLVRVHEVVAPAVVLGSTQSEALLRPGAATALGVEVARRRSGGGVVTLGPGEQVWVDVVVPAGDPLWDDDVCHASWWLGDTWAAVLGGGTSVHRGAVTDPEASRTACFAALGPGEVSVAGAKVVGISQRRTRWWARFQCVAYLRWDPAEVLGLLQAEVATPAVTAALVERVAAVASPGRDVVERFLTHLPG